jgi:hypothetical protein
MQGEDIVCLALPKEFLGLHCSEQLSPPFHINPLEPSKFFFEFFLQIWGKGVLLAQTGKSKWIFTYNKVSQRNLTKTPRTLNYARAVSLVLYEDVNDLSCTVKICLKTDKFKPV